MKQIKTGFLWKTLSIAFMVTALSMLTSSTYSQKKSVRMLEKSQGLPYDVIVVPGVPLENGKWSRIMKARVYWSKFLIDRGIANHVMYSGSAVYTPYVEAEVMAMYAEAIGIPKDKIYVEAKAEHSTENIYYSHKYARKLGFERIALATDPFQSRMLKRFIKNKVSGKVGVIPIVFDTLKTMEPLMIDPVIDYQSTSVNDFTALTDRKSFLERMRGTMGKTLNEDYYE